MSKNSSPLITPACRTERRVPGEAQHFKGVYARRPWIVPVRSGPGSAVHRFALHRIRDTRY